MVTHGLGQVRWTNCIAACDVEERNCHPIRPMDQKTTKYKKNNKKKKKKKQKKKTKKKTALRPFQLEPHLLTGNTPRQQQLNFLKVLKISEIIEKCKNQKQT